MKPKSILAVSILAALLANQPLDAQQFRGARLQRGGGAQFVPGCQGRGFRPGPQFRPELSPEFRQGRPAPQTFAPGSGGATQSFRSGGRGANPLSGGDEAPAGFGHSFRSGGRQADREETAVPMAPSGTDRRRAESQSSAQTHDRSAALEEHGSAMGESRQPGEPGSKFAANLAITRSASASPASSTSSAGNAPAAQAASSTQAAAKAPATAQTSGVSLQPAEQAGVNAIATTGATDATKALDSALGFGAPSAAPASTPSVAPSSPSSSGSGSLVSDIISGAGDALSAIGSFFGF